LRATLRLVVVIQWLVFFLDDEDFGVGFRIIGLAITEIRHVPSLSVLIVFHDDLLQIDTAFNRLVIDVQLVLHVCI
jgi:hypothetical protein